MTNIMYVHNVVVMKEFDICTDHNCRNEMVQCAFSWDCYYETITHCDRALNSDLLIVKIILKEFGLKRSKKVRQESLSKDQV